MMFSTVEKGNKVTIIIGVCDVEYNDHATSICCTFDTIQISPHTVALGNAHRLLTIASC